MNDLKFAFRMLMKNPGFTAVVVLTLALGIGANTAIFSAVDRLLVRPLCVERPGNLATVGFDAGGNLGEEFCYPIYRAYREANSCFTGLIAYRPLSLNVAADERAERIEGMVISGNYFSVLGVTPAVGRTFLPEEDQTPGTHPVAVISHRLWRQRFGGDSAVIGRTMNINAQTFSIIGVAPPEFTCIPPSRRRTGCQRAHSNRGIFFGCASWDGFAPD